MKAARSRHRFSLRPSAVELLEPRIAPAVGMLRIAEYNITASGGTPRSGLDTILAAMGQEVVNGNAQPLDVFLMQEVQSQATTSQAVVNLLNAIYGAGTYARGSLDGASTGSGTQGLVYNTHAVQLVSESLVGMASTSGQPRQALRYKLHPVGYSSSSDFYVYNSHYKSANDSTSRNRRLDEANAIRADADALGQGVQILYVGDFNTYTSTEPGYQKLLSSGNGQAFDPIDRPGSWHNSSAFAGIMTQAPANSPPSGLTGGGLDDRFDFQLFTSELTDGAGLDYSAGSYHTFGNNGSVPLNGDINSPSNTALAGIPNRTTVLNLLTTVTDHLPVVADYQVIEPNPTVQFTAAAQSVSEVIGSFTITAQLSQATTHDVVVPFSLGGTASTPDDYTVTTASPLIIPAGSTTGTIAIDVVNDSAMESNETILVTLGTPTGGSLGAIATHTATILDNDSTFGVSSFAPTASGFYVGFNRAVDPSVLNLYDTQSGELGPSDVTLVGPSNTKIAGSLIVDASGTGATFVATGGTLSAGGYTLTLRSAADGFRDSGGHALDGDADGSDGGNFTQTFTVATSSAVVVRLPDFVRGAGQSVSVPATSTSGLPLLVSSATGITSLELFIDYDPSLLTFSAAAVAIGLSGSISFDPMFATGRARLTYTSPTPLTGGATTLAYLQASVPADAPYTAKEVLDLNGLTINAGAIASVADDAVHVAAYLGDASGNGDYSALDASLIDRVSVALDAGFSAYQLADPVLVGDVSGNGAISSFDSSFVRRAAIGLSAPQIPALPDDGPTSFGGLDPKLSIGRGFTVAPGGTAQVPIDLEQTDVRPISLEAATIVIRFDPSRFVVSSVRRGKLTAGWGLDWAVDPVSGTIVISTAPSSSASFSPGARGTLAVVALTARRGAAPGPSALNLLASGQVGAAQVRTALNEGRLSLIPAPTNADDDATDGAIAVAGPAGVAVAKRVLLSADVAEPQSQPAGPIPLRRRNDRRPGH